MQQASVNPNAEEYLQRALANEWETVLRIYAEGTNHQSSRPPLTDNDARRIIECLRNNLRLQRLEIFNYDIHNGDVLNVFLDGLPLCTAVTRVTLYNAQLSNKGLERLLPSFYSTSVTSLDIGSNGIQGQHGGEVIRDLLVGNDTLLELNLSFNPIGPEGARGLGQGLADGNSRLQILHLYGCQIGNEGLEQLVVAIAVTSNNSFQEIYLGSNRIEGAEGGQQISLLLQCFSTLKVLVLEYNNLGPLGACALALGLVAEECQLESLELHHCNLGNDGVANLVPDDQVNSSLATLNLSGNNIQGLEGRENVITLASRCTNLDCIIFNRNSLSQDQRQRLDLLLLNRKCLH